MSEERVLDDIDFVENAQFISKENWMKTHNVNCATFVEPTSADEIASIVKDTQNYPSPCRPCGNILSPSALCTNGGGTTISTAKMNVIHGIKQVIVPPGPRRNEEEEVIITCIDCEPGVMLRDLQMYAHKYNVELPYAGEVGIATIGGTCFALTKDSCIGKPPIKEMMIGDVASMLWSVQMVEEDGIMREYCLYNDDGTMNSAFLCLLDSYGSTGIAVRMLIATRPQTPCTTKVRFYHFNWRSDSDNKKAWSDHILNTWNNVVQSEGNVFCAVSLRSNLILVEERSVGYLRCSPFSCILGPAYTKVKKIVGQRGLIFPKIFKLAGGCLPLYFHQQTRNPGKRFAMDVPSEKKKISFSYYGFPIRNFHKVFVEALDFTEQFEQENGFAPNAFLIYFVKLNGKRVAGPYSMKDTTYQFSFDPVTDNPQHPLWKMFCASFNSFVKDREGKCALNQTLALESTDRNFGRFALGTTPSKRFASPWLQQFAMVDDV